MKPKTLGDLLQALQKLSPEQLKKPAIYISENMSCSGVVTGFGRAKADLYWAGGDDPSELMTKNALYEYGFDEEEVAGMDIQIHKGAFIINF